MVKEEIISQIKARLEEIRPFLQEDEGDVEFQGFDEVSGYVSIKLLGNCLTCPLSKMTVRGGIERVLMNISPGIKRVEEIRG